MCKESIRIGRRIVAESHTLVMTGGSYVLLLPPNPTRVRVSFALNTGNALPANDNVLISSESDSGKPFWGVLNLYDPFLIADIETFGQVVMKPVYVLCNISVVTTLFYTDYYLTEPLESV